MAKRRRVASPARELELELELEAVLPDAVTLPVPLSRCHVAVIAHPRHTARLIRALNALHPVPGLQHLKRVRRAGDRLEVILSAGDTFPTAAAALQSLTAAGLDKEGLGDEPYSLEVPVEAPRTRAQFVVANEAWSCNFHEDADLEKLLAGTMFSSEELRKHKKWLDRALRAAEGSSPEGGVSTGAVVVDPQRDAVVAIAADCRGSHPLRHAVMNAVDLVAHSQLGGAWDVPNGHSFDGHLPDKPPPVGTVRNREPDDGSDKPVGPYLCTGYDAYLSREPCTMCGMALVHSRVRRVFYCSPSPDGVLGTRAKLHTVRALNHHYQVFRIARE